MIARSPDVRPFRVRFFRRGFSCCFLVSLALRRQHPRNCFSPRQHPHRPGRPRRCDEPPAAQGAPHLRLAAAPPRGNRFHQLLRTAGGPLLLIVAPTTTPNGNPLQPYPRPTDAFPTVTTSKWVRSKANSCSPLGQA